MPYQNDNPCLIGSGSQHVSQGQPLGLNTSRRQFLTAFAALGARTVMSAGMQGAEARAVGQKPRLQEKRNLEIIRLATEAMNRGDLKAYVSYFAEDTINFDRPVGREGIRRSIEDIFTTFPDYRHDIVEVIAKSDSVVVRCRTSGTHRGVGKLPLNGGMLVGVEPTQKRFEVQHIHWYKLRDGKIAEHTANRDDIGMMRQLGLLPPVGTPK